MLCFAFNKCPNVWLMVGLVGSGGHTGSPGGFFAVQRKCGYGYAYDFLKRKLNVWQFCSDATFSVSVSNLRPRRCLLVL